MPDAADDLPEPRWHPDTQALRFWVRVPGGALVGASVARLVLHYRFHARPDGADAVATYQQHRRLLDDAVLRRVAAGSREPVMLREHDLPPATPAAPGRPRPSMGPEGTGP